jgi:hypothetical protein
MDSKPLYFYKAYSLTLASEFELPLARIEATPSPDVIITFVALEDPISLHQTYDGVWYKFSEEGLFLKFEGIGAYLIENGTHINFSPQAEPTDGEIFITVLLNTVMAILLFQRGLVTIHGSCVAVEKKAYIFVGHKGYGKSTMAGFLHASGNELVSDDVCAIAMDKDQGACVYPSYPCMKLWPDAMDFLDIDAAVHKKVHCKVEKRVLGEVENFSSVPVQLGGIVLLAHDRRECSITRIVGHESLIYLLPHQFINRFLEQPVDYAQQLSRQLATLLQKISVYRLARPKDLALLPEVGEKFFENVVNVSLI